MIQETNIKKITDSLFDDIQKSLMEEVIKDYAKLKCKELLEIVAEKAEVNVINYNDYEVDKDSVLNAVDLNEFIV